ncbi:MAG: hypothetical protein QXU98_01770 [Candidatus Parvarchaeota archaeon]
MLEKETSFLENPPYEFIPYYYGHYSNELEDEAVDLVSSGKFNDVDGYSLTPTGFRDAYKLWNNLTRVKQRACIKIKGEYNRMSTDELRSYVYEKTRNTELCLHLIRIIF